MHGDRTRLATAAAVAIVVSVAPVPGLAQSNAVRSRTVPSNVTMSIAAGGVGDYVETSTVPDAVETPANLTVPSTYRTTVEQMLERSPMFRRQCLRLAAAPHLAVVVRMLHPFAAGPHARTQISQTADGRVVAAVEINPLGDFTELLAHELEHVIEQLDGIDLKAKAAVAESGVRNSVGGTFETSRAVRIGSVVAFEARTRR
jgi:hypothetical protein